MIALSTRQQWLIGCILVALFIVTRSVQFANLVQLPGASWSVFFLAAVYLRSWLMLPLLLVLTGIIDYSAVSSNSVSDFCVSPAYVLLIPAYSCLWLAGRWYTTQHQFQWRSLFTLSASLIGGAVLCELFASGGFYLFSGLFEEPSIVGFADRLVQYFPPYLQSMLFYVGTAALMHVLVVQLSASNQLIDQQQNSKHI